MQVKTITTAAGVNEIDFGNDSSQSTAHFYWLKNLGSSTLYVSANPDPIAEKDDVAELPAKGAVSVETDEGKIYVLGAGKVEIHRTNSKFCPFDWQSSGSGGGGGGSITVDSELSDTSTNPLQNKVTTAAINEVNSALETKSDINHIHDISASGNPVVMCNLQGGVPFSEITVSGKNLLPAMSSSVTRNGITYTVNADGTITLNGTAEKADGVDVVTKIPLKAGVYTLSGCPEGGSAATFALRAGLGTANALYGRDYGNGLKITAETDTVITVAIQSLGGVVFDNVVFRPQLELGETATAYEPPIAGRNLTVSVSGKNLIPFPYYDGNSKTHNGITFTVNSDGAVTANGTATDIAYFYIAMYAKIVKNGVRYAISGCPEGANADNYRIFINERKSDGTSNGIFIADFNDNKSFTVSDNCGSINIAIQIRSGVTVNNLVFRPQLELGATVTPYAPYHGSTTTITPTSNPYAIPDDIRQQDGLNVVSVSEGELSVVGVQKNAAIKRIWDDMSMDLLFDGLALAASPAENINLGNYSKYLINCYYDPNAVSKGHCISIVVEYDRLKNIVDKSGVLIHSLYTSYALELHFSGIMDNANYYARQKDNEAAAYYTRIYGIK